MNEPTSLSFCIDCVHRKCVIEYEIKLFLFMMSSFTFLIRRTLCALSYVEITIRQYASMNSYTLS